MAFYNFFLVWLILLIAFVVVRRALTVKPCQHLVCRRGGGLRSSSQGCSPWLQIEFAVFAVVSAWPWPRRPLVKKRMTARRVPTNADINVGRKGHRFSLRSRPTLRAVLRLDGVGLNARSEKTIPAGSCGGLSVDGNADIALNATAAV